MSKLGHHNYNRRPGVIGGIARQVAIERCIGQLNAELGDTPMTPTAAFDLGREGKTFEWRGRRAVDFLPPLPTDCVRPYDSGLDIERVEYAELWDGYDYHDKWLEDRDEMLWDATSPLECRFKAQWKAEFDAQDAVYAQTDAMWERHEGGNVPAPIFLTRVREESSAERGSW